MRIPPLAKIILVQLTHILVLMVVVFIQKFFVMVSKTVSMELMKTSIYARPSIVLEENVTSLLAGF